MLEGTKVTLSSTNDYQEGMDSINHLTGYQNAIKERGVYAIHLNFIYSDDTVWEDLYQKACEVLNPSSSHYIDYGGVAAVILTVDENIYTGVCVDTACSIGMCAERNAISSMLTNHETRIKKLVCVGKERNLMLPCGVCREFMMQLSKENENIEILVERGNNVKIVRLKELIPNWWGK